MNSIRTRAKQTRYLLHFVARSFLITILCFMSLISLAFLAYFGDLFLSTSKGVYKNPLFGAYIIVSPSMVPTIKINDAIIIKRVDNDSYKIGDVITFASNNAAYYGKPITHRIVSKSIYTSSESLYATKGDNNDNVDAGLVKTNAIYGKVLFKIPAIGKIESLINKPANFLLSLLIPALLFLIYDLTRIFIIMSKRKV